MILVMKSTSKFCKIYWKRCDMKQTCKFWKQTDIWFWNHSRKYLSFRQKNGRTKISGFFFNILFEVPVDIATKFVQKFCFLKWIRHVELMSSLKIITKTFKFAKKSEVLKFPISFPDLIQSTSRYCKKLSYDNYFIAWNKHANTNWCLAFCISREGFNKINLYR